MGLKNGQLVLKGLQTAAPNAFYSTVNPKVGYSTFAVDLMSLWHSLMNNCQSGRDIVTRLKAMLKQHRQCSKPDSKILSVIALEDYAETPINKEIERAKRIDRDDNAPYTDSVELTLPVQIVSESGQVEMKSTISLLDYYPETLDSPLPKDFARARSTPGLARTLLRYISRLIEENVKEITDNDANHIVVVDGFRDYKNLSRSENENARRSEASKKIGIWRSDNGEILPKSHIGEGEVKACCWAFEYLMYGHVLVHANDGDIIALLTCYSARIVHSNLITGVMSTSYLFPVQGIYQPVSTSKEEKKKIFCSLALSSGIYESINKEPTKGLVMTPTFLLFMLMCGNDYVDSLPLIGPAKLLFAIERRRAGLLDRAVVLTRESGDEKYTIEVDEKAVLDTLLICSGTIIAEKGLTSQFLAAWLRRVIWTMDYNVNAPLGYAYADCCEKKDGLSVHGFKIGEDGRCVKDDVVWNPTLVSLVLPSDKPKKTTRVAWEDQLSIDEAADRSKKRARTTKPLNTKDDVAAEILTEFKNAMNVNSNNDDDNNTYYGDESFRLPSDLDETQTIPGKLAFNFTPVETKPAGTQKEFINPRVANLATIRNPVPFGNYERK